MSKILIAEDDENLLISLAMRLRAAGFVVVAARDAEMAMTVAERERPDLALLDISMPGEDGFQLAERMKGNEATLDAPIIFLTASDLPELRDRADEVGAIGFHTKPYDFKELLHSVRAALGPKAPASH